MWNTRTHRLFMFFGFAYSSSCVKIRVMCMRSIQGMLFRSDYSMANVRGGYSIIRTYSWESVKCGQQWITNEVVQLHGLLVVFFMTCTFVPLQSIQVASFWPVNRCNYKVYWSCSLCLVANICHLESKLAVFFGTY